MTKASGRTRSAPPMLLASFAMDPTKPAGHQTRDFVAWRETLCEAGCECENAEGGSQCPR